MRPFFAALIGLTIVLSPSARADPRPGEPGHLHKAHAIAMHGEPKYGPGFTHFDYVNPDAPKGGEVRQSAIGSFDNLNPYILKGQSASGIGRIFETLMTGSEDEAFSQYGLIAETIEWPEDRSWVAFTLRPEARWHDGTPITVEDVIFSLETLKTKGHPFYRAYYGDVVKAETSGERKVKFTFANGLNRELPLIIGELPILSRTYYETHDFEKTTLVSPLGSGPYRVESVDPGRSITYARIEDYWGADLPVRRGQNNFDVIRIDNYRDPTVAMEAFKAHEYDFRSENASKVWATAYVGEAFDDGRIVKEEIAHSIPTGMQGFVFNTRRDKFADPRLRRALGYAFDFEWTNKNLFNGAYTRTMSYFSNSELASSGLPDDAELALLEPYRGQIPAPIFNQVYEPPKNDGTGNARRNLRKALKLLGEAGWIILDSKLVSPADGQPLEIEFLIVSPLFERIIAPFIKNLEKLGVAAKIRLVDSAQYQKRLEEFDFDMIVATIGQSLSPGNEQNNYWTTVSADTPGSRNYAGIKDPAVDSLVATLIAAPERDSLIAAARALDRVLLSGYYVIPHWHIRSFRVAYWNKFARPAIAPKYSLGFDGWWVDPALAERLTGRKKAARD